MTDSPRTAPRRPVPDFDPVPVRARKDGWTPGRQRAFIRVLHVARNVGKAAKAVGMSRKSAYRLRERVGAKSFAAAWEAAFAFRPRPVRVNISELWYRALFGKVKPVVRGGQQIGTITQPDNDALLKLYDRVERNCRNFDRSGGRSQ